MTRAHWVAIGSAVAGVAVILAGEYFFTGELVPASAFPPGAYLAGLAGGWRLGRRAKVQ